MSKETKNIESVCRSFTKKIGPNYDGNGKINNLVSNTVIVKTEKNYGGVKKTNVKTIDPNVLNLQYSKTTFRETVKSQNRSKKVKGLFGKTEIRNQIKLASVPNEQIGDKMFRNTKSTNRGFTGKQPSYGDFEANSYSKLTQILRARGPSLEGVVKKSSGNVQEKGKLKHGFTNSHWNRIKRSLDLLDRRIGFADLDAYNLTVPVNHDELGCLFQAKNRISVSPELIKADIEFLRSNQQWLPALVSELTDDDSDFFCSSVLSGSDQVSGNEINSRKVPEIIEKYPILDKEQTKDETNNNSGEDFIDDDFTTKNFQGFKPVVGETPVLEKLRENVFFSVGTATPKQQEENVVAEGELPILDEFENDVARAKEKQAASVIEPQEAFVKISTSQGKCLIVQNTVNQKFMLPNDTYNGSVENYSSEIEPECKYLEIYISEDLKHTQEASEEDHKPLGNESENIEAQNCEIFKSNEKTFESNDENVNQISENLQKFAPQKLDSVEPQSFDLKSQSVTQISKKVKSVFHNELMEEKTDAITSLKKCLEESKLEDLVPIEDNKELSKTTRGFSEDSFISETTEDSEKEKTEEAIVDGIVTPKKISELSKMDTKALKDSDKRNSDVVTGEWVTEILSNNKNEECEVSPEASDKDDKTKVAAADVRKLEDLPSFSEPFLSGFNKLENDVENLQLENDVGNLQIEGDGWTHKTEKPTPGLEKFDQATELGKKADSSDLSDFFKDLYVKVLADSAISEIENFDVKLLENRREKVSCQLDDNEPPTVLQSFSSFLMRSRDGETSTGITSEKAERGSEIVTATHQEADLIEQSEPLAESETEKELVKSNEINDLYNASLTTNEEPQSSKEKTKWIVPSYSYKDMMQVNSDDDELYDEWPAPCKEDIASSANRIYDELEKFNPQYMQHLESDQDGHLRCVESKFCRNL